MNVKIITENNFGQLFESPLLKVEHLAPHRYVLNHEHGYYEVMTIVYEEAEDKMFANRERWEYHSEEERLSSYTQACWFYFGIINQKLNNVIATGGAPQLAMTRQQAALAS